MSVVELLFYVIPVCICLFSDIHTLVEDVKVDISGRADKFYNPRVTIGHILKKLLLTFIPAVNICKALMYLLTDFAEIVISVIDKVLSTPLITKKKN